MIFIDICCVRDYNKTKDIILKKGKLIMADSNSSSGFRDNLIKRANKFAGSRFVRAIINAGYSIIPFSIIAAIFLILEVLPQIFSNPGFVSFYGNTLGRFSSVLQVAYNSTLGISALIFGGTFAYSYTEIYEREEKLNLSPWSGALMFLMAFFLTVPQLIWKDGTVQFFTSLKRNNIVGGGYAVSTGGITRIASVGIFTAIIVAWLTVQIYRYTVKHNWEIKMPSSVPQGVANAFSAIIPGLCIAIVVLLINLILVFAGTDLFKVLYIPFSWISNIVDTWWGFLLIIFFTHFLWWFGIHGGNIMMSFWLPIALSNMQANVHGAFHFFAGDPINTMFNGGAGATLGVAIWICFFAKSSQLRALGKVELVPAIFNINEPLLFGLPIVYNIQLLIPFVFAPLADGLIGYIAIMTHLVPKIIVQQPWPLPVGFSAAVATASWQGAILQIINAIVAFLIWYPFIKHYDNTLYAREQANK